MSLWNSIAGEFIDIIEWLDDSNDVMVKRFERHDNEIKNGAKLTVRESQVAVFVNSGEVADVFKPGLYTLTTENLPILATLLGWKYGFDSPFKAEVYFINTKNFTDLKWGTQNPVILRDKDFGPIRVRAFGTYTIKVTDPVTFLQEVVGTDGLFTVDEVSDQLRHVIVSRFAAVVGQSGIPVLDLAGNYDDLGTFLANRIQPEFTTYGLELTKLLVENISLPPSVEEAMDKRSSMGVIGDLKAYTQYQAAEAMAAAATGGTGSASEGIGLGLGFAMAQQFAQSLGGNQQASSGGTSGGASGAAPPPLPGGEVYHVAEGGKSVGPYDIATLQKAAATGHLKASSLVWTQGMAAWQPAGEVEALKGIFPPPAPPPAAPPAAQ